MAIACFGAAIWVPADAVAAARSVLASWRSDLTTIEVHRFRHGRRRGVGNATRGNGRSPSRRGRYRRVALPRPTFKRLRPLLREAATRSLLRRSRTRAAPRACAGRAAAPRAHRVARRRRELDRRAERAHRARRADARCSTTMLAREHLRVVEHVADLVAPARPARRPPRMPRSSRPVVRVASTASISGDERGEVASCGRALVRKRASSRHSGWPSTVGDALPVRLVGAADVDPAVGGAGTPGTAR